jgi:glycosyltransferase involved in cell wall biosynthesis
LRIAIANSSYRLVGGVETYLQRVMPDLRDHGCELAFFSEAAGPDARPALVSDEPVFCISKLGADAAFAALRNWRPDVLYVHGIHDPAVEAKLAATAPAVLFTHAYAGTCISGRKSFRTPTIEPCDRRFGPACLAYYYVRRCGGLNPVTMWDDYRLQETRLLNLRRYRAILTSSEHMQREYLRHGFASDIVHLLRLPIGAYKASTPAPPPRTSIDRTRELRLLFAARMVFEKGGEILLKALPQLASSLGRPVQLDLVGEGYARPAWEKLAGKVMRHCPNVRTVFHPWLEAPDLAAAFDSCDLLVVPSIWPEPFGLTGPEAGLRSLPAAAFAVGGIPEWLHDGVNGHLADAHPARSEALAAAITRCLSDESHYSRLREGAYEVASQFATSDHVAQLVTILTAALSSPDPSWA